MTFRIESTLPLTQAWQDWAANAGHGVLTVYEDGIAPVDPMREAFFAGAATMAQLLFQGQDKFKLVVDELAILRQLLAERFKEPSR